MQSWHESIVQAIELGKKEGEFKNISNSTDIAWRLIAFVCGLEGIYQLGLQGLAENDFKRHTGNNYSSRIIINGSWHLLKNTSIY